MSTKYFFAYALILTMVLLIIPQGFAQENYHIQLICATPISQPTSLVFELRNLSTTNFLTTPVLTNYSRVVITDSDGKSKGVYSWLSAPPIVVKPGESKEELIDLSPLFDMAEIKETGYYRIYWKVMVPSADGKKFDEVKSNELTFRR